MKTLDRCSQGLVAVVSQAFLRDSGGTINRKFRNYNEQRRNGYVQVKFIFKKFGHQKQPLPNTTVAQWQENDKTVQKNNVHLTLTGQTKFDLWAKEKRTSLTVDVTL